MKMLWIRFIIVIIFALCLAGCGMNDDSAYVQPNMSNERYFKQSSSAIIYSISIEGHEYIVFDGAYKGGIIHSESCPCKKRATE